MRLFLILFSLVLFDGCQSTSSSSNNVWGHNTTLLPSMQRFKEASINAATQKRVWVPAIAGVAFMSINDLDENTVDWAADHNLIFSSSKNAEDASNSINDTIALVAIGTALATPGDDQPNQWLVDKSKGLGAELLIYGANGALTNKFKHMTGVDGPDNTTDDALPSAHAVDAFTTATLAERHIHKMQVGESTEQWSAIALDGGAYLSSWARVEANKHYPSDVLMGAAMANFLTTVMYDTFVDGHNPTLSFQAAPSDSGIKLSVKKKI